MPASREEHHVSNMLADGSGAGAGPPEGGAHASPPRLGFSFRLAGGSGRLTLGERTFFGWLRLDRLELEVPELRLPIDLAVGPETFQRHRTRARQADLRMEQADLDRFVAEHAPALGRHGVEELRAVACEGHVDLTARVRESGQAADLTARVYLEASQGRLRFACGRALTYGHLATPAPLVVHRIMTALLGAREETHGVEPTSPGGTGSGRHEVRGAGPWASAVRGLGDIDLDAIAMALWHILPTAGWRLPDTRDLVIAGVRVEAGALSLRYRTAGDEPDAGGGDENGRARAGGGGASPESIFLFDTLERLRDADERLCAGDVDGAMRQYRARLAAQPDDESLLVDRLLAVGAARRELFDECSELASRALTRWPDFAPGHAALASIAVARGDAAGAGARYHTLSQVAAAAGERDWAALAALVAARLLRRVAPAEASGLYERVLELSPGHPEATGALVDRHAEDGRWSDLVGLLRARAAATDDPVRRARDHVHAAQVLCGELGDPVSALEEVEIARRLDPLSPAALEVLADVQVEIGQPSAAAGSLERAALLHQERRDRRGQVRALLRAAGQLEGLGELARAETLHRAVLELVPGEPAALRGAAAAAARRGEHAEAARLLRALLAVTSVSPTDAARDSLELARHLIALGEDAGAALERAAASGAPLVAADAHEVMAEWARREGRSDEAVDQLGRAIEALSRAAREDAAAPDALRGRAAELAMTRAELLGQLGQREAALVDQERAFALSSEAHPIRLRAARALGAVAHARGDRDAERYWLGAMLAHPNLDGDRADLLARRAQLAFEAGQDLPGALLDLDRALEEPLPPARAAAALRLRADVLGALGDQAGRARSLDRAHEAANHPRERAELSLAAAEALLHTGDAATALARARTATSELEPVEVGAARPEPMPELRRSSLLALGEAAWRARDWAEIERAYSELVTEPSPDRAERAYRLGMAREALGQHDAAAAAYELVIAEPGAAAELRVATWRSLAALYEHTAELGRAALAYESFAGDERADLGEAARAEAWYKAGDLYRKAGGRERDAERCLEAALQLVGDHMPALDVLERLKRDEGAFDRVAVILGRKIAATARQPATQKSLLVRLAALHEERLGRLDVARESYARALAIDPHYRPALRFAARDARALGDLDTAVRATARLASQLPGEAELGAQTGEDLAAERIAAALDLAELARSSPTRPRLDAAIAAVRHALDGAPGDARLAEAQAQLADALAAVPGMTDGATPAGGTDAHAALVARARAALEAGLPESALAALEAVDRDSASDALLELRAQVADSLGDAASAGRDLEAVRTRALARGDASLELRATRRLAALAARQRDANGDALALYERVLALDPDDLSAAEACADIFHRRGDADRTGPALLRVLEVARRSGAGRAREVRALRELAWAARQRGDVAAAASYLDRACAQDPISFEALRERADLASAQGDAQGAAHCLERLVDRLEEAERAGERPAGPTPPVGEVCLELADLYYDHIGDTDRARISMRRAADRFGRGARREATLRLLASEASSAGDAAAAADALEAIPGERLSQTDRLALAKCYQRLGRDQRAIGLLEAARREGSLSDEGALLLFALHRHRKQKVDLAASLERRARGVPRKVASARLREALDLYSDALGDAAGIARVEAALEQLEQDQPDFGSGTEPGTRALSSIGGAGGGEGEDRGGPLAVEHGLAEARAHEEAGQHTAAAARYEELWLVAPDDMRPLEALERLYLARGDADAVSEVLGRMIVATEDRLLRAALWSRRARLYRDLLHREGEAYRCLREAFANDPDSGDIAHALRSIAMARGEWGLSAELLYREIAAAGAAGAATAAASSDGDAGQEVAALYNELGLVFDQKLGDAEQAQRCYEHALGLDPAIPAAPKPLARLYELAGRDADAAAMYENAATHATAEVERGTLLRRAAGCAERAGRPDDAGRLLALASRLASDAPPGADDLDAAPTAPVPAPPPAARVGELEAQLALTTDPVLRGDLRRQIIEVASAGGDTGAVERHAAALMAENQADLSAYLALKSQAAARGNWKALAGLLQARAAALDTAERAELLCELGRLFDKELADPAAAVAAYERVLEAVPDHPAALEALADIAYVRGDWLRARDLYARLDPSATSLPPDVYHYRCGEIAEVLGRDDEACAAFAESVRHYGGSRQALTALARTALRAGELPRAIEASRALLDLIPPDDVRAVRAARLQLAELCGRSGDRESAIAYYEHVLADEPKSITALSSLLALYSEAGDYPSSARVLRSLIALTPAPAQRAELLYRLGELCRRGLGDADLAADSYLKAIDLDPDHLPTLRRLLDYYWLAGDHKNLLDVAIDLDRRGALMDRVMDADALAGAMLVAVLGGARELATRTADFFGASLANAMASALVEASARGAGMPARDLVAAALALAARAGIAPPQLGAELRRCAGDDPRAASLLAAWAAARS